MKHSRKSKPSFDDLFDGLQSRPVSMTEEKIISEFIQTRRKKTTIQKGRKSKRSKVI